MERYSSPVRAGSSSLSSASVLAAAVFILLSAAAVLLLLPPWARAQAPTIEQLYGMDYVNCHDAENSQIMIGVGHCNGALRGFAVNGIDAYGEYIDLTLRLTQDVSFTDSLRSAGEAGFVRQYAVLFLDSFDETVVAADTLTTIPGLGLEWTDGQYDWVQSGKRIFLPAWDYVVRIVRLNDSRAKLRLDCLWLNEWKETPVAETSWGRIKSEYR